MSSWGWGLHDGISAFIRRDERKKEREREREREIYAHELRRVWAHSKKVMVYKPGGELSPGTESSGTLNWTSQPPNYEKINFCCLSHPICGIFWAAQADWDTHTMCVLPCCEQHSSLPKSLNLRVVWLGPWTMRPDGLGLNPSSATYQLCDFEQVTSPLCASVSPYVKWGW